MLETTRRDNTFWTSVRRLKIRPDSSGVLSRKFSAIWPRLDSRTRRWHMVRLHALPEVLRNQHEGFLTVASRVAVLHDEIRDREKAYLMLRRKFFDDESDPFEVHHQHQQQQKHRRAENGLRSSEGQRSVMMEQGSLSQSASSQKSFRDIAKETLRPGSAASATAPANAAAASTATKPAFGGSLFGGASTTSAAPATTGLFGSTATPAASSLFGSTAPGTSTSGSSLFEQPAASTSGFGRFKENSL